MKRFVIIFTCLVVLSAIFGSVYFMFLKPKSTLEILEVERFGEYFVVTIKNNIALPSDNYIPDSMRIRVGTIIVYNSQNQVINTWQRYSENLGPQQTRQITTSYPLNNGYSVVVKGLRADSGEEIFSNKYYV